MSLEKPIDLLWHFKRIWLRYSIGDVCLFRAGFSAAAHRCRFDAAAVGDVAVKDLAARLCGEVEVVAFQDLRIERPLPRIRAAGEGLVYCLNQVANYFAGLDGSFEDYLGSLSAKTRSTLRRTVRKFSELSGGKLDFRVYRRVEEMRRYHTLARAVAAKTYQEKLFQGALPETEEFCAEMERLAVEDRVRGYLLSVKERPAAYLYVPIRGDVADYAYLGYDPEFAEHSPGTVLLWAAMESLFGEARFKYFNFSHGVNQTKETFCTGQFLRADVYLFRNSLKNRIAVYGHAWMDDFSRFCGRALDRVGLRRMVKRFLRSG